MKRMTASLIAAVMALALASHAADIFVAPEGRGGMTGADWSNALNGSRDGFHIDVKTAITTAVADGATEVNVYFAGGTYAITNQLGLSSIAIPVKLSGGYLAETDGSLVKGETATKLQRNTSYNTRFLYANALSDLTVEGMTFSGGKVVGNVQGGAIHLISSDSKIENCIFTGNATGKGANSYYVGKGGAVYATGGALTLKSSSFNGNGMSGSYYPHWGGAVCTLKTDVLIDGCSFNGNFAKPDKVGAIGGAVSINGYTATIKNSRFDNNYATTGSSDSTNGSLGGALAVRSVVRFEMSDCYFANNYIQSYGTVARMAGCCYFDDYNKADGVMTSIVTRCVFDSSSLSTTARVKTDILLNHGCLFMTNCIVMGAKGNHAGMIASVRTQRATLDKVASNKLSGSQVDLVAGTSHAAVDACFLSLVNCTIADGKGTGVLANGDNAELHLKNCISCGHTVSGVVNAASIEYSCIQEPHDGAGNFVADPHWTGAPYYHLLTRRAGGAITDGWFGGTYNSPKTEKNSPCLDVGAPGSAGLDLEPHPNGRHVNLGAYGGTPWASKTLSPPPTTIFAQ